jgi:hypothetical protein
MTKVIVRSKQNFIVRCAAFIPPWSLVLEVRSELANIRVSVFFKQKYVLKERRKEELCA